MTTAGSVAGTGADDGARPAGATLLYESGRTRVLRLDAGSGDEVAGVPIPEGVRSVVWKETRGPGAAERCRHELAVLARLAGLPGVPQVVTTSGHATGFAVVDDGGVPLAAARARGDAPGGVTDAAGVRRVMALGLALSRVLVEVHGVGVVHKDLNPANIVVRAGGEPVLIDWDLATTFAEERPGFAHESAIAGTLAYLAPEQSGRTGWGVDQRADLYALGATLYELVAGRVPFVVDDALALIHAHLAVVPPVPHSVNAVVPPALSDIIMRLLEKEPDRRYQSAEGLAHDLTWLLDALAADPATGGRPLPLGACDFPRRLTPPSRLVGREAELVALRSALEAARAGQSRGVLVTGEPGVGKSALLDELRSMVAVAGGWYVRGKFDQYRQDEGADALGQALRAVARLVLAEPDDRLAEMRERVAAEVGADAGLLVAAGSEVAAALDVVPVELTGIETSVIGVRTVRAVLGLLRAVASPERPLVLVIDDLQWAGAFALSFLDAVLADDRLGGVLLVGAYRDGEVDNTHPLSAVLTRWERLGVAPTRLHLATLSPPQLGTFLAEMLRLPTGAAAEELVGVIGARTAGNPYDTVELVNALRRDGALTLDETGWHWDPATIRTFVGEGDVVDLLEDRLAALPAATAEMVEVCACLGGDVSLDRLALVTGRDPVTVEEELAPALEDGLLLAAGDGGPAVRFRHDRVHQAAYGRQVPEVRRSRHRDLARRLAEAGLGGAAAEQYLAAPDVDGPDERDRVVALFREGAAHTAVVNPIQSERFLSTALELARDPGGRIDETLVTRLLFERHAALVSLGRLVDADAAYAEIERRVADPGARAEVAGVRMVSLTHRGRPLDAVELGVELLSALGFPPPAPEAMAEVMGRGVAALHAWVAPGAPDDASRPEPDDPRVLAAAMALERTLVAAYNGYHPLLPWVAFQAHQLWIEEGPCAPLAVCLAILPVLGPVVGDYEVGAAIAARLLAVCEARGYEAAGSIALNAMNGFVAPWCEPLETTLERSSTVREGLLRWGDFQSAAFAHMADLWMELDSAPDIERCQALLASAGAFWARVGEDTLPAMFEPYRRLLARLRGLPHDPGAVGAPPPAPDAGEQVRVLVELQRCCFEGLGAAVFADADTLCELTSRAEPLLVRVVGLYLEALGRTLRGLALAEQARGATADARAVALEELDRSIAWMAARAAVVPANFGHLVHWLDAERAWVRGDHAVAVAAFDAAMAAVARRRRPWHAALITERAARFHLDRGLEHLGHGLLVEARAHYARWGAEAKVAALDEEFPALVVRSALGLVGRRTVEGSVGVGQGRDRSIGGTISGAVSLASADLVDLLAVVRASQALSSETNLDRLQARVVEVLTAMTGATSVRLVLWHAEAGAWFVPAAGGEAAVAVDEAGVVCRSAFRYAERTGEPLLVPDATRDDRFARDPYLAGVDRCSLLVVPVTSRGARRAMLVLENRLAQDAFTPGRLDAVVLIAGQLAVSLDNALAGRFRSLVQRSSELTLVHDRDGRLTYASPAASDVLGIDGAQLVGRPLAELVHPDDREAFAAWDGCLDGGAPIHECRVVPAGGDLRWVEVTGTDLTSDPAVEGTVLHLRDVTERRRLERELRHAQKLESVGQLAAGVAHEINTPVQFITDNLRFIAGSLEPVDRLIRAYRDALARTAGGELARWEARFEELEEELDLPFLREEVPQAVRQALDGAGRVATIVRAMKAFAHPGGDAKGFVDLNEAITSTLIVANAEIRPVADLVTDLGPLPLVWCNLGDLNQVVLNLVVNAAHAMGEAAAGGRGRGTLTVRTRDESGTIVVEVADTGDGIPDEIADRVFDQFFTTKPVGIGTGQGLALAHTLVRERHGGSLTFTSAAGVGTTFTIRIPPAPDAPPPDPGE